MTTRHVDATRALARHIRAQVGAFDPEVLEFGEVKVVYKPVLLDRRRERAEELNLRPEPSPAGGMYTATSMRGLPWCDISRGKINAPFFSVR